MKKNQFMARLSDELKRRNVADAADVIEEYEQHFAFKLADGYSEEEIAAKLGDPAALAAQFESADGERKGSRPLTLLGLGFANLLGGMIYALLIAWGAMLAAAGAVSAALAVYLLGNASFLGIIPQMPYWCGAILAVSLAALSVLLFSGCAYYAAFLRQLLRAFVRFQKNALAAAAGEATLPPLPVSPRIDAKRNRRLRAIALGALAVFAASFVLSYLACSLSAGGLEFWHIWGWFE